MNFFRGALRQAGGRVVFVEDNPGAPLSIELDAELARRSEGLSGRPVVLGIRPEAIHDSLSLAAPDGGRTAQVKVEVSEPMGSETLLYLDTGDLVRRAGEPHGPL